MPNAKDAEQPIYQNILVVGPTGAGKTTQIRTLSGKVFAFLFDPNALASLQGADVEYEEWLPEATEIDTTIKGFNKGSKSDRPSSAKEPRLYIDFVESATKKAEEGFFDAYDWICLDSMTFLQKAMFDRNAYINNRYGKVEELSDYRIVGSKLSDLFRSFTSERKNIYVTGHITSWQDETTKKLSTELQVAGSAKTMIPLLFTNIWLARAASTEKEKKYEIQTRPETRGLQCIRSQVANLDMYEDVTIQDFDNPNKYGIGKILNLTL